MVGNVVATPHLGNKTRETLRAFYGDMPKAIAAFARGAPIRVPKSGREAALTATFDHE